MARLPSWRDQLPQSYAGARKWGTGVNAIHAKRTGYEGRNIAPGNVVAADVGLITEFDFGAETDLYVGVVDLTFMDAHPNLDTPKTHRVVTNMPAYGPGSLPTPQGNRKRIRKEGVSYKEGHTNAEPVGLAGEGWTNKTHGDELDARTSAPVQYEIQTSMAQRDLPRVNSTAVARGTDDARTEIRPRHVGMKVKNYSGGQRHADMFPFQQEYRPRPWRFRGVGTGPVAWMEPNAENPVKPRMREVPADVYMGENETVGLPDEAYGVDEGYF